MKLSIKTGAALVGVLAAMSAPAQADSSKVVQVSEATLAALIGPKASAGASFGSPLAFGANWGDVGAGVFAQTFEGAGSDNDIDGSAGFVMGFGNARKAVGLEVSLALSSLIDSRGSGGGFGDNGSFGAKLHTSLPYGAAFAVGLSNIGRFGDDNDATKSSLYAVASKAFSLPIGGDSKTLVLNLGIGDEAYNDPGKEGAGVFGSAAFYITKQVSVIGDYTGRFLNTAVSVAPIASQPLTITVGAVNLTERFGGKTEFAASVGYGFQFR